MMSQAIASTRRSLSLLGAAALIALASAPTASAQWQRVVGDTKCRDAGRGGVAPVTRCSTDGYIACGETFSPGISTPGCNTTSDILLVRSRANGTKTWAWSYDLGGNDSALDIRELTDGTGYIVVGVTDNANFTCNYQRSMFLMRINCDGGVNWVYTYTDFMADETVGTAIAVANGGTNPRDYLIAGYRTRNGAYGGHRDGFLMRVDAAGLGPKSTHYFDLTGAYNGTDQVLYAIDEAANGDVLASGYTTTSTGTRQGMMIRTNQNLGTLVWLKLYGGSGNEEFRTIEELTVGAQSGRIVVGGYTSTNRTRPAPYLLKTDNNGNYLTDARLRTGSDNSLDEGEVYCVREIRGGSMGTTGELIVSGRANWPGVTFGANDILLTRVSANLTAATPATDFTAVYGGANDEIGWSVAEDNAPLLGQLPGFIVCGFTMSPLYKCSDPEQMFLVKTDLLGGSLSCPEKDIEMSFSTPNFFTPENPSHANDGTPSRCNPFAVSVASPNFFTTSCTCVAGNRLGNPGDISDEGGHDPNAVAGVDQERAAEAMVVIPNPVKSGTTFQLAASLGSRGTADVVVADVAGKVVYRRSSQLPAGSWQIPVSTEGWSAGAYLVTITANGYTRAAKVVLTN